VKFGGWWGFFYGCHHTDGSAMDAIIQDPLYALQP
jgi:hypothetical protein